MGVGVFFGVGVLFCGFFLLVFVGFIYFNYYYDRKE